MDPLRNPLRERPFVALDELDEFSRLTFGLGRFVDDNSEQETEEEECEDEDG